MAELLEIYKKSIFSNIGNKVSQMQGKKVPDNINIGEFKTKNILEVQKDFFTNVVKPYGTILQHHSEFGNIIVNPTTSILSLFSKINNDISPIVISESSNLLKLDSIYDDIQDPKQTNLLYYSKLPDIENQNIISVLNYILPELKQSNESSVLQYNSTFDDIVEFKTKSVLDFNSNFDDITILPYSNVLSLNSRFDDLIIKDIGSILKIYVASNLPSTIPGVVDFFEDYDKIKNVVDIILMPQTAKKPIANIIEMPDTPEKSIADLVPMPNTPEKNVIDVLPMPDPIDKPISDINPPAETLEKPIATIIEPAPTPIKKGVDVFDGTIVPEKKGLDVFDGTIIPEKIGTDVEYISKVPDKLLQATEPGAVNFIPDTYATGFTKYDNLFNGQSEYNIKFIPSLYEFNFNDNSYGGVLNQYAVYFSKYPPLTNVTYKTVIDWAYNRTIRVPQAQALYDQGFHTPLVPIGSSQLLIPPYRYANDRLPTWANTYVSTLEDVGSTLIAGYLSQRTIDLLDSLTDVNLSPWKQSPVIFHQLAGEIYWKYSDLGTVVRNAREATINFASNLVGRTLSEYFIPKVESAIGGVVANAINNTLNAAVLDDEKVLMLYHILMGTKYTKSKAYFDRLAKTYSSKYGLIGDNAVNLYNDSVAYKKYITLESARAAQARIPDKVQSVTSGLSEIFTENGIVDTSPAGEAVATVIGTSDDDNSISPIKSTLLQTLSGNKNIKIPIGDYQPGLINEYITKAQSKTFGSIVEPEKYYSINTPIEARRYTYDGPILTGSINKNYPSEEYLQKNPALQPKQDLNALNTSLPSGKNLSDYNTSLLTDFSIAGNIISNTATRENQYSSVLRQRLLEQGKLLEDKGFPSIKSQFSDTKNRLNMVKMQKLEESEKLGIEEFGDNDLIDFYFEDISSLSSTQESIVIPFRAIITTISDGTNANWSPQDYMGRADKFWIYQGFERHVAINFEVAINSKDEFISSWNKINYLQGMCYPVEYPAQISLKAPIMSLTIGNLFNRIQVILNSINYSFDISTLWELEKGYQLPMYIKISVDFTVIFADIPKASARHIAQNQGWVDPAIFDYNETNKQSQENRRLLMTNDSGSLTTVNKNDVIASLIKNNPITFV